MPAQQEPYACSAQIVIRLNQSIRSQSVSRHACSAHIVVQWCGSNIIAVQERCSCDCASAVV